MLKQSYHSLYGAWRLARFDASGMNHLDFTESGFWRSFQAAVIGLPLFLILSVLEKSLRVMAGQIISPGQPIDLNNYFLLQLLDYAAIWPAFALAMIPVCRLLKVDEHYAALIISYNWSRVLAMAVLIPPYLLLAWTGFGNLLAGLLTVIAAFFVLAYQWFAVKTAIGGAGLPAGIIIIVNFILTVIVSFFMTWLFSGFFIGAQ
jgi:hypothetical protein